MLDSGRGGTYIVRLARLWPYGGGNWDSTDVDR